MQASYASGYALGLPHRILGTQKSMRTIQYGFACLMRTFSKATEARSAVVAGQTGGVQRTTERTNRHNLPSPCRTPSVRSSTSDCRPQGGHPCIERMRDAQGRSNVPRPLQRRFKARKKPEGYTSTPTGLKRLKTGLQRFRTHNTAFHVNGNGKGTPSGVPQPIHKRKLVLVKEEFDASSFGGGTENRTPVHESSLIGISRLSHSFSLGHVARSDTLAASQPVQS